MVTPVRLEQLIWTHVVKNSKTDHAVRKLPSGDGDKVEKARANHTKKYSRKNKKVVDVADEDKDNTSTQKKQKVLDVAECCQPSAGLVSTLMLSHYACVLIHYIIAKDIWIELVSAQFPSQT
jgi:hypothetical protein